MRREERRRRPHALDRFRIIVAVLVFVTFTMTVAYSAFLDHENWVMTALSDTRQLFARSLYSSTPKGNQTTILMWTAIWGRRPTHLLDGCPQQNPCKLTYNRSLMETATAVVFHLRDLEVTDLPKSPSHDGQKFVAWTQESPFHSGDVQRLPKSYFHWSLTYLNDSNVVFPYGGPWISPEVAHTRGIPPLNLTYDNEEVLQQKKIRGAVWFVSSCDALSGRAEAVAALSRVFRVDVAGKCASNVSLKSLCPRSRNCDSVVGQYYFYVAAENSICKDYITEKYWGRFRYFSVPIVMRRYIYERHLPPKSFIAMDDFDGPSAMAARLTYLMDNPDEYMTYFAWRKQGWTFLNDPYEWIGICNLCAKLLSSDYNQKVERVPDFGQWYSNRSRCEDSSFATAWSDGTR